MSSSDTDLETGITEKIALTKKKSTKKKSKPTPTVPTDHGKNEGDDPHWAYEPPEGAHLLDHTVNVGEFEWDTIKNDEDTEVWLIRVPDSIKPKHLKGLEIDSPASPRTARVGGLTKKHVSYDVWCIGDDDAELVGAEELRGLSCLLPRKRKDGRLYIAPKRVSRRIVLSARPTHLATAEDQAPVHENAPRPSYPKDLLKHAFVPYGARSQRSRLEDSSMGDDDSDALLSKIIINAPPKDKPVKAKELKGKKRTEVDGESPKKELSTDDDSDALLGKIIVNAPPPKDKPAKTKESKGRKRIKVDEESPKKSKKHKPNP